MIPERSRRRRRHAMIVVRASARALRALHDADETWTPQGQHVLTMPVEQAAHPDQVTPANNRSDAATARLLLAHAHRARHLLADRAVLANIHSTRRVELMQEIQRMRRVMRTLEDEIDVTTRSLEAMERLVVHLRRVTDLLQETGVMPVAAERDVLALETDTASR